MTLFICLTFIPSIILGVGTKQNDMVAPYKTVTPSIQPVPLAVEKQSIRNEGFYQNGRNSTKKYQDTSALETLTTDAPVLKTVDFGYDCFLNRRTSRHILHKDKIFNFPDVGLHHSTLRSVNNICMTLLTSRQRFKGIHAMKGIVCDLLKKMVLVMGFITDCANRIIADPISKKNQVDLVYKCKKELDIIAASEDKGKGFKFLVDEKWEYIVTLMYRLAHLLDIELKNAIVLLITKKNLRIMTIYTNISKTSLLSREQHGDTLMITQYDTEVKYE